MAQWGSREKTLQRCTSEHTHWAPTMCQVAYCKDSGNRDLLLSPGPNMIVTITIHKRWPGKAAPSQCFHFINIKVIKGLSLIIGGKLMYKETKTFFQDLQHSNQFCRPCCLNHCNVRSSSVTSESLSLETCITEANTKQLFTKRFHHYNC